MKKSSRIYNKPLRRKEFGGFFFGGFFFMRCKRVYTSDDLVTYMAVFGTTLFRLGPYTHRHICINIYIRTYVVCGSYVLYTYEGSASAFGIIYPNVICQRFLPVAAVPSKHPFHFYSRLGHTSSSIDRSITVPGILRHRVSDVRIQVYNTYNT